ncbi:MAG: nucleotidyltransferase domain-containing protein [Bdellovibrionaceae bacterium]|nr:nucleotidyltransferase domain-containing protein [Pseudobdellovibrionaceae bacterium]
MKLDPLTLAFIKETILKRLAPETVQIFLFGSYAKGVANDKSDIDIAIKMRGPLPAGKWALLEEDFENSDLLPKVDLVDYYRVTDGFKKIIDEQSIPL